MKTRQSEMPASSTIVPSRNGASRNAAAATMPASRARFPLPLIVSGSTWSPSVRLLTGDSRA